MTIAYKDVLIQLVNYVRQNNYAIGTVDFTIRPLEFEDAQALIFSWKPGTTGTPDEKFPPRVTVGADALAKWNEAGLTIESHGAFPNGITFRLTDAADNAVP